MRIGWLATADRALPEQWLRFKDYRTIRNSAPSEILGIIALRSAGQIVDGNLRNVIQNLTIARRFFERHAAESIWFEPNAGSVMFPAWRGNMALDDLCRDAVEEHGVMLVPASIFDMPAHIFGWVWGA